MYNDMIFSLGVVLLELSYGQSLRDLAEPEELDENGAEHPLTEIAVAQRLASLARRPRALELRRCGRPLSSMPGSIPSRRASTTPCSMALFLPGRRASAAADLR